MSEPLRIAMVGMGWAGTRQTEAAREVPDDVAIVALVDSDEAHLAEQSRALGVPRTYATLAEALDDPDVEAVSLATPHALHAEQAVAASAAGRHVLVEKPMAMSVADATTMIDAADRAGVTLFVAESETYMPYAATMRDIARTGEPIGELTFARLTSGYRSTDPSYPGRRRWLTRPELGGTGSWLLQGVHAVAALRFVLGEVASIHAHEHRTATFQRPDLEATMTTHIVLESGLAAQFVQTTETNIPQRFRGFQLFGERGMVIGGRFGGYDTYLTAASQDAEGVHADYPDGGVSEYAEELRAFALAVRSDGRGLTDGRSERRTLAVLEAGLLSAATGAPIVLRDAFPDLDR